MLIAIVWVREDPAIYAGWWVLQSIPSSLMYHHTEPVIHNQEKRYLIISQSNLLKRSKCFHKCKGRDCSQPTFTSDSDTRKETANHGALYLL